MEPVKSILAELADELPDEMDEATAMRLAAIAYAQGHQDGTEVRVATEVSA